MNIGGVLASLDGDSLFGGGFVITEEAGGKFGV